MTKYYCPYCSPHYQFHKQRSDGVMICGQCGDPLTKVPFLKPTQFFGLLAMVAFISQLVFLLIISVQDQKELERNRGLPVLELVKYNL